MKFTSVAVILSLFSSAAYAVSVADLPTCSVSCFATAIASTSCGLTDTACQCGSAKDAITASVTPCVIQSCADAADQAKTLSVATELCANVSSSASVSGTSTATRSSTRTATSSAAAQATSNAASSVKVFEVTGAFGLVAVGMFAL